METPRILIIRLSSIGDIVQALGVPRHLHRKFPKAEIHWVVRSDNESLVANNPYVTQVIPFVRSSGLRGWLSLSRKLSENGYTHVYDAHNNFRSRILCAFLRPPFFIRRSKERFKRLLLFWFKIQHFYEIKNGIDSYVEPLISWGIHNDKMGSEMTLSPEVQAKVRALLPNKENLIAIAPGTAWPKKTWPVNKWSELLKLLLNNKNLHFLILGGPNDDFCKDLLIDSKRIFSLQGKLSLIESAAAIGFCKTLVAGDTGLLHMAEALKKNVVCLWGPTHLGHTYRTESITLEKKLWCRPCTKDGSGPCINREFQKCMTDISEVEVLAAVEKVLAVHS